MLLTLNYNIDYYYYYYCHTAQHNAVEIEHPTFDGHVLVEWRYYLLLMVALLLYTSAWYLYYHYMVPPSIMKCYYSLRLDDYTLCHCRRALTTPQSTQHINVPTINYLAYLIHTI